MIALDTHIAVWLVSGEITKLSKKALKLIDTAPLSISPLVRLELEYLREIGRILIPAKRVCETLEREFGVTYSDASVLDLIVVAEKESWTRDPFDRLIVADARFRGVPLLSCDKQIAKNFAHTVS